jgi:hypothetical protein
MICKQCGNEVAEGNQFCENCGAAVEATEVVAEATPEVTTNPGKAFGLVSMITGICAFGLNCLNCIPYLGWLVSWISLPCAVAAIVFGILGKNKSASVGLKNTQALVGLILGIVFLALAIVGAILLVILFALGALSNM